MRRRSMTANLRRAGALLSAIAATLVLSGCFGFLSKMHQRPVSREPGKDCVFYEFVYRAPHLGNGRWGDPEFAGLVYPAGPGSYRYYGKYAMCPAGQPVDPSLVGLWQAWRRHRVENSKQFWFYNETIRADNVQPVSMIADGPSRTRSIRGTLYRYRVYRAYFRGCDYWATQKQKYKCVPSGGG
jgi:hypothetical protein